MTSQQQRTERQAAEQRPMAGAAGSAHPAAGGASPECAAANSIDHLLARKLLRALGQPDIRLRLWDGSVMDKYAEDHEGAEDKA